MSICSYTFQTAFALFSHDKRKCICDSNLRQNNLAISPAIYRHIYVYRYDRALTIVQTRQIGNCYRGRKGVTLRRLRTSRQSDDIDIRNNKISIALRNESVKKMRQKFDSVLGENKKKKTICNIHFSKKCALYIYYPFKFIFRV